MSKTNTFETDILALIFTNVACPSLGDSAGLQPAAVDGSLWIGLWAADPTDAGLMTGEASYGGYARVNVARTAAAWDVSNGVAANLNAITFPAATGGATTATHFGIMADASLVNSYMFYAGALTGSLAITSGITPQFAAGTLTITED